MENNTQKPIMMEINDFKKSIVDAINTAGMPMAIVTMILREVLAQCSEIEKQQYDVAVQQYAATQKDEGAVEKVSGEVVDEKVTE